MKTCFNNMFSKTVVSWLFSIINPNSVPEYKCDYFIVLNFLKLLKEKSSKLKGYSSNFELNFKLYFFGYFFFLELKTGNNCVFTDPNPIRVPSFSQ